MNITSVNWGEALVGLAFLILGGIANHYVLAFLKTFEAIKIHMSVTNSKLAVLDDHSATLKEHNKDIIMIKSELGSLKHVSSRRSDSGSQA